MAVALPLTPGFDANQDAGDLRGAMRGAGTDDSNLIHIVCRRHPHELMAIYAAYKQRHGRDLYDDIKAETSGAYQQLLLGLFHTPVQYDVSCLHSALKKLISLPTGSEDTTVIEILASRTNGEKLEIQKLYELEHKHTLAEDIKSDASGDYKECLLHLLDVRDESTAINIPQAQADADALYKAGEGKIGTDEKVFIKIFTHNSWAQLRQVAAEYVHTPKNKHHHTLRQAVESEFSFNIKSALLAILYVAEYGQFDYWQDCASRAMKGLGTNDTRLIRVILTAWHRYSIPQLKAIFNTKHGKSLHAWIKDETSFNYRKALLTLIGEN